MRPNNKQYWGVSLWLRWGAGCMCIPACGWCLAWVHFSSLNIRHPMFGKPHNIPKVFLTAPFLHWFSQPCRAAYILFLVITYKNTQIPCCTERIIMIRAYVHTQKKCIYKQILLHNQNLFAFLLLFFTLRLTHIFFLLTLQGLSLYPKATHWVYLSRKSPCWEWYQTPQRYSAPCRAVYPCWAPHPSTRLPWLRSRDVCHPRSASTHRSWEGFYAGQSSDSFNMTASWI